MRLQFLGTGAAEGIPPLFSRNDETERIRREGGPDLRTRSSFRIGEEYQIDFGPDAFFQSVRCNCDFYDLRHLIITHMHADHIQLEAVVAKNMPYDTNGEPIILYGSVPGMEWLEKAVAVLTGKADAAALGEKYILKALEYYERYTVGELILHTVRGNHRAMSETEYAINPLIELPDGRTLLYAVDTGYYEDASFEYLTGHKLDVLVMETTFGSRTDRGEYPAGHLDAHSFLRMLDRMERAGAVSTATKIYATHINPKHEWNHAELQTFFDSSPYEVTVASDCLEIPERR